MIKSLEVVQPAGNDFPRTEIKIAQLTISVISLGQVIIWLENVK